MDCSFENNEGWFRYRACAIIIEDGHVLMAKNAQAPYYYSVGGGVLLHESAEDAVCREVLEETGLEYKVDRLAFIHENFFVGFMEKQELKCHELALYFVMRPKGQRMEIAHKSYIHGGVEEHMHWLPIHGLNDYHLYPAFFKQRLAALGNSVEHIVTYE